LASGKTTSIKSSGAFPEFCSVGVVQAQFRGSSGDELNLEGLFHDLVAGGERHGARNRAAQNRGGKNGDTDFARRVETFQDSEILPEWGTKVAMASKK